MGYSLLCDCLYINRLGEIVKVYGQFRLLVLKLCWELFGFYVKFSLFISEINFDEKKKFNRYFCRSQIFFFKC